MVFWGSDGLCAVVSIVSSISREKTFVFGREENTENDDGGKEGVTVIEDG